jgi:hypothetical protein
MERYQTHIFGKDRAMTVEEEINELIAPNIRNRLFAALSYPAASQEQMLPYVPEHLRYMKANEDKIFLSDPFIKEGHLVGQGLTVLRVNSEHDAHALMQAEPLIKGGTPVRVESLGSPRGLALLRDQALPRQADPLLNGYRRGSKTRSPPDGATLSWL